MKYFIFHSLMKLKEPFSAAARRRRRRIFIERMNIKGGERIIDLGGTAEFWADFPLPLDLTIINLPDSMSPEPEYSTHKVTLLPGDACDVDFAKDMSFDIAFSNSVIEHVGDSENRRRMASEVKRLAPSYWVQTPSIWFPIEAHCNMPFWWFYPKWIKNKLIAGWQKKLPAWTEMVVGTTVLMRSEIRNLFPNGQIWTEWKLGFPKSYVAYKPPENS